MSDESQEHYALELDRARKAFKAAKILYQEKLYEDSVSRSYYAVMHAVVQLSRQFLSFRILTLLYGVYSVYI